MVIERTSKEVIIRLPLYVDTKGMQRLVDYLTYKNKLQQNHKLNSPMLTL